MSLIVIVDDRDTNRTIYSRLALSIGEGVIVRAFGEPGAALEWLAFNRPDMIVTDHDMPLMNGEEFIARFRAMPHSAAVPIMMITVNGKRLLRLRALESGATDFLTTPIDHYEFLSRARNLLKLSKSAGTETVESRENSLGAGAAAAAREVEDPISLEAAQFQAQCGEVEACALHVVEIAGSGGDCFDPAIVIAALRRQLRGDDLVARIDRRSFAVLQKNVVDAADANACARRLSGLRAAGRRVNVGTSLPGGEAGAQQKSAAERLSEAAVFARAAPELPEQEFAVREFTKKEFAEKVLPGNGVSDKQLEFAADLWRFLPRIDLRSGLVVGAQALRGAGPAEAGDAQALRAALACASTLRASGRPSFRLSLRLSLKRRDAAPLALLVAPLLAGTRVPPSWLDLRICAREALEQGARAEEQAQALKALGIGLTLDIGALTPDQFRGGYAALRGSVQALLGLVEIWRPTIQFPCGDDGAVALAHLLGRGAARELNRRPKLLADGVASAAMLKPLLRDGVRLAQGSCFGAPFSARDLEALLAGDRKIDGGPHLPARQA